MVPIDRVNAIWAALVSAKVKLFERGATNVKTSEAVDFIVSEAMWTLGESYTREEILEAWLYETIHQVMAAGDVKPVRKKA